MIQSGRESANVQGQTEEVRARDVCFSPKKLSTMRVQIWDGRASRIRAAWICHRVASCAVSLIGGFLAVEDRVAAVVQLVSAAHSSRET